MRSFIGTFVENRPLHLEDAIAVFLRQVRLRADAYYGAEVDKLVLGRPARFSEDEASDRLAEERLKLSAEKAGFKEVIFYAEPLAAARSFIGEIQSPKTVLICDFGGGTSDFSIVRLFPNAQDRLEVLGIGGLSVAGDAMDSQLMKRKVSRFFGAEVQYKVPMGSNILRMPKALLENICSPADIQVLRERETAYFLRQVRDWSLGESDRKAMDRLFSLIEDQLGFHVFELIEQAKCALSETDRVEFRFEYPEQSFACMISAEEFQGFVKRPCDQILEEMDATIAKANLKLADIDLVLCTGGTAKLPLIQGSLRERFTPEKLHNYDNFHAVIRGLAHKAQRSYFGKN